MAGYFDLIIICSIGAVTFGSAIYFFGNLLSSRMALQDLEKWTKPHRTLSGIEKSRLMANYDALSKIDKKTGALLIPKDDNVYLLEGQASGFGLESMTTKVRHITIGKITVEFPTGLSDYLRPGLNIAEVALSKSNAVALSLNSVFLDPPQPKNTAPELIAAIKRLQSSEAI